MSQKRKNTLPPDVDSFDSSGKAASAGKGDGIASGPAEEYQAANERRYRAFFESSMDAILLTSPDGRICAANPSACRLFGISEAELTTLGRAGVVDPEDPNLPVLLAERQAQGSVRGELTFIRKDGSKFRAEISSSLFEESLGETKSVMIIRDITDRKLLEEEVRKSEEQYRRLFMDNPQPMWIYDLESLRFLEVNDAAVRHYGYSRGEFRTMTLKDIRPEEDIEDLMKDIDLARANKSPDAEWRHIKKNGRQITVEIVAHSITYDGRQARHVMINDVTARRKVEKALRESEQKFRQIYEEGPYGMALITRDLTFLMANRTFCRLTGYSEMELRKLNFLDITHPDDVSMGLDAYRRIVSGEIEVFRTEKRYLRRDRTILWASITVTSVRDDSGGHLYNLVIIEDITERRDTEENVKLLNKRLQLLIEAVQELSTSTSLEGIMKTVRTTVRSLMNAEGAAFILRDGDQSWYVDEDAIAPLWKGQRFPMTMCVSGWAMMNRQVAVVPDIYSDTRVPVKIYESTFVRSMALAPIRISDPLGAIGAYWKEKYTPSDAEVQLLQSLADSAAKAVENLQLIDDLEKIIDDRTAELQAVNRELEAFSYSVSHDLRAPLRHINGYSEIVMKSYADKLPEEAVRHLRTIVGSATQMGMLIDDLLTLSRTGRAELRKSHVSMNVILTEAITSVADQLKDRDIDWQIEELPESWCDASLMRQVWINLIDNAVKYTRKRQKAVISIGYRAEDGGQVYSIRDNGVGFDMKYAQKLFGVFQRMHSSSEFEGTGIGLANVQRIITRHGGKIWAEAEPGRGASFFFKLPLHSVLSMNPKKRSENPGK